MNCWTPSPPPPAVRRRAGEPMLMIQMLPQVLIFLAVIFAVGTWFVIAVVIPHRRELKARRQQEQDAELERSLADFDRRHRGEGRL